MKNKIHLGKKIKQLRKSFSLSQKEFAKKINLQRPTISQIESGHRELSSSELIKIGKIFDISIDQFLEEKKCEIKRKSVSLPKFNKDKFKQILLYVLKKCGAQPNIGETVLYKLLYFIDFNYYELYEEYLTGESYRKISYGPAPCHFKEVIDEMIKHDEIQNITMDYHQYLQKKYLPQIEPKLDILTAKELELIDNVINRLSSLNALAITDYSHKDIPYEITKEKEIINYETVFYRKSAYSVRNYPEE